MYTQNYTSYKIYKSNTDRIYVYIYFLSSWFSGMTPFVLVGNGFPQKTTPIFQHF